MVTMFGCKKTFLFCFSEQVVNGPAVFTECANHTTCQSACDNIQNIIDAFFFDGPHASDFGFLYNISFE